MFTECLSGGEDVLGIGGGGGRTALCRSLVPLCDMPENGRDGGYYVLRV